MKRDKPVTVCASCGGPGYDISLHGHGRCQQLGCEGIIRRATGEHDWNECPWCKATGTDGTNTCILCDGCGWLFVGSS
jgi:hypothetical protein